MIVINVKFNTKLHIKFQMVNSSARFTKETKKQQSLIHPTFDSALC